MRFSTRFSARFSSRWATSAFLALLLVAGACMVRSTGVSWDEPVSRTNGGVALRYALEHLAPSLLTPALKSFPELSTYVDRDYGVAFELPAVALEQVLGLSDTREIYLLRHALTFLVFLAGVVAAQRLAARRWGSGWAGLLAAAILVTSPRIFGEADYNSKDIVFMAAMAMAMNTLMAMLLRPGLRTALLHALACAFAIDVRLMGVVLPAATVACLAVRVLHGEAGRRQAAVAFGTYAIALPAFVVAMFPWLWGDPLSHFAQAFGGMAHFRWEGSVLYFGERIRATHLPWHYAPAWIAITTPLPWLALGGVGIAATAVQLARAKWRLWTDDGQMQDFVFLALFTGPLVAVIALHSVLYDGWRQLYFVYPAFVLLAAGGAMRLHRWLRKWRALRRAFDTAIAVAMASMVWWSLANHPWQHLFFNALAGKDLRHRFDMDYWGVANRQAIEYLLATDPSPVLQVRAESDTPIQLAGYMLDPAQRARLRLIHGEPVRADLPFYRLVNWRLVRFNVEQVVRDNADRLLPAFGAQVDHETFLMVYRDLHPGEKDPSVAVYGP